MRVDRAWVGVVIVVSCRCSSRAGRGSRATRRRRAVAVLGEGYSEAVQVTAVLVVVYVVFKEHL